MKERIFFLNMFPDYEPPEELISALSQAVIVAADIDPVRQSVEVAVEAERYIAARKLEALAKDLQTCYGLQLVHITATHPAHQLHCIEPEALRDLFVAQNSIARGPLAGALGCWEDDVLPV